MNLNTVAEKVRSCTRCVLWKHRLQALPGSGKQGAKYLVVVESPDEHADRLGEIWDGREGKKISNLMEKQGIQKESVFLTSLVKCSPLQKKLDDVEIKECNSYLKEQIKQLVHVKKIFVVSNRLDLNINLTKKIAKIKTIEDINFQITN